MNPVPQERGPIQPQSVVEPRFEAYRQAARGQLDLQRQQVRQQFETYLDIGMQNFAMMVESYNGRPPPQRINAARMELNRLRIAATRQGVNLPYAIQRVNGQWGIVRTGPPDAQQTPSTPQQAPNTTSTPPENPLQTALTGVNTRHNTLFTGITQTTGGNTGLTLTLRNDLSPQVLLSELQPLLPGRTITVTGNTLVIPGITQADLQQINPAPLRESNRYQSIPRTGVWTQGQRVTHGERTSNYRIGAGRIMYEFRRDGVYSFEDGQWQNVLERRNLVPLSLEGRQYIQTLILYGDTRFVSVTAGLLNCTYAIDPQNKDLIEKRVTAGTTTFRRFSIATRTWRPIERYDAVR